MALQQKVKMNGQKVLQTSFTSIYMGEEEYSLDSYVRIENLNGNKESIVITLHFYVLSDRSKFLYSKQYEFTPDMESDENFIKQGYHYLKTLTEFENAVDILEV